MNTAHVASTPTFDPSGPLARRWAEMIITDTMVHAWLGPLADTLHRPLRLGLFVVLTVVGWWLSRRAVAGKVETVR